MGEDLKGIWMVSLQIFVCELLVSGNAGKKIHQPSYKYVEWMATVDEHNFGNLKWIFLEIIHDMMCCCVAILLVEQLGEDFVWCFFKKDLFNSIDWNHTTRLSFVFLVCNYLFQLIYQAYAAAPQHHRFQCGHQCNGDAWAKSVTLCDGNYMQFSSNMTHDSWPNLLIEYEIKSNCGRGSDEG